MEKQLIRDMFDDIRCKRVERYYKPISRLIPSIRFEATKIYSTLPKTNFNDIINNTTIYAIYEWNKQMYNKINNPNLIASAIYSIEQLTNCLEQILIAVKSGNNHVEGMDFTSYLHYYKPKKYQSLCSIIEKEAKKVKTLRRYNNILNVTKKFQRSTISVDLYIQELQNQIASMKRKHARFDNVPSEDTFLYILRYDFKLPYNVN